MQGNSTLRITSASEGVDKSSSDIQENLTHMPGNKGQLMQTHTVKVLWSGFEWSKPGKSGLLRGFRPPVVSPGCSKLHQFSMGNGSREHDHVEAHTPGL